MSETLRFERKKPGDFHSTVKERVYRYFEENKISQYANGEMYGKALVHILLYALGLGLIYSNQFQGLGLILIYGYLGLMSGLMGFNISHDALHGSFSPKRNINRWVGYTFDYNGESSFIWKETHNVRHHTFTNITGYDGDIDKSPLIRFSPNDQWHPFNRFQPIYTWILYSLVSIPWVYYTDYKVFWSALKSGRATLSDAWVFYSFKVLNLFLLIFLPIMILTAPWWQILLGNLAMHMIGGFVISVIFQLAHVVEAVSFPTPKEGKIEDEWAVHEMKTTANFATDNHFLSYWLGGLNFQIEHHLFPQVCHVHYPALSRIVKETALEFGVPYHENKTFSKALYSHAKLIYKLSKSPLKSLQSGN